MSPLARPPVLLLALVLLFALLGCDTGDGGDASDTSDGDGETVGLAGDEIAGDGDWATYGYTYENTRHVPFDQINADNVRDLGRAWSVDFQAIEQTIPGGMQGGPLVIGGTAYIATTFNHVFALDAATGDVQWHFSPGEIGSFSNFGVTANRGLAYCDGKLYMMVIDMRLMSIDAETGELVKEVPVSDAVPEATTDNGYYQTSAPICYEDKVIIGSSGADNGVRGFVMAYDTDLEPAWPSPFWTVPPEGQDWRSHGRFHGGGTVWVPVTVDSRSDTLYIPTANPSPDFFPELRPGNNPKTNGIIAIDIHSGEEQWWRQQTPNDQWDYDTGTPPLVYDATIDGDERRVVSVGSKSGYWYAYDAETGEEIYTDVAFVDNLDHQQLVKGEPVAFSPSALGGQNYAPSSYDPTTNQVFIAAIESKAIIIQAESAEQVEADRQRGDVDTGSLNGFGESPEGWHDYGTVAAIDLDTGERTWKFDTAEPERGGVTTTATGLGFVGGGDGYLRAFDTETGGVLWQFQLGAPIAAPPVIYEHDGEQYVAISVGGTPTSSNGGKIARLEVFKLGGEPMQFAPPATGAAGGHEQQPVEDEGGAAEDGGQQGQFEAGLRQAGDRAEDANTFDLGLVSGTGANNGLNFNEGFDGNKTIRVPVGAVLNVTYRNPGSVPHSAVVTAAENRERSSGHPPAFESAASPDPQSGFSGGEQRFTFTATRPGRYALVCGVPGHAAAGMWIWFEVYEGTGEPGIVDTPAQGS